MMILKVHCASAVKVQAGTSQPSQPYTMPSACRIDKVPVLPCVIIVGNVNV